MLALGKRRLTVFLALFFLCARWKPPGSLTTRYDPRFGVHFPLLTRPSDLVRYRRPCWLLFRMTLWKKTSRCVLQCFRWGGRLPTRHLSSCRGPGRFRGELSCGGRSWPDTYHKSAHYNPLPSRFLFLNAFRVAIGETLRSGRHDEYYVATRTPRVERERHPSTDYIIHVNRFITILIRPGIRCRIHEQFR